MIGPHRTLIERSFLRSLTPIKAWFTRQGLGVSDPIGRAGREPRRAAQPLQQFGGKIRCRHHPCPLRKNQQCTPFLPNDHRIAHQPVHRVHQLRADSRGFDQTGVDPRIPFQ